MNAKTLFDITPNGARNGNWFAETEAVLNAYAASGRKILFDVTNMEDMEGVLNSTGQWANNITSHELRYIQQNWNNFDGIVTFYENRVPISKPW